VPSNAAALAANVGLPPVRPAAGLYDAMFARGAPQPGQRKLSPEAAALRPNGLKRQNDRWRVDIYLASRVRRDITREAFDGGEPIEFDIGVSILDQRVSWNPTEVARVVGARADGTCLPVGPGVIHRRQDLRFTLTTEEMPTGLTCRSSLKAWDPWM
jgi:hypothetical protein